MIKTFHMLLEPKNSGFTSRTNAIAERHPITDVANGVTLVNSLYCDYEMPTRRVASPSQSIHHCLFAFTVHF